MNLTEFKREILKLLNESGRDWEIKSDDGFNIAVFTENDGSFIVKLQNGSSMKRKTRQLPLKEFKEKYLSPLLEEAKRLGMDKKEIALLIMGEEK